ncbi:hypothetical protein CSH63_17920 [Micromonospora tulbaghiae]|uniref:Uncharacterized protein n=1 Tax=Micromonospora tulbaghiae TaxID=479978 RepID=A0A386WNS5_9ACTN|nr:hypothetical protein [Micromonospora tulbaghiae]AYF29308.1 hypothetical protein CSH63_17920 [Micromonospora tulbaghiae]
MSVKVTRVRLNRRGMRELLCSEGVQEMLAGKASAVAAEVEAAGIRVEGEPGRIALPVTVAVEVGAGRAFAQVILDHPAGLAVEAKHGLLTAAIDAAGSV